MCSWVFRYGDPKRAAVFEQCEQAGDPSMTRDTPDMNAVVACIKSNQSSVISLNEYLWDLCVSGIYQGRDGEIVRCSDPYQIILLTAL